MVPVILLFAKAPVPGKVKTRLAAGVGPEEAAALHTLFVNEMLDRLPALAEFELHLDTPTDAFFRPNVSVALQSSGDLGARMLHALTLKAPAVILGSDSPTVPDDAIRAMLTFQTDVMLAPTDDGGYWAIAARRTHPQMFSGVRWSTEHALADTAEACEAAGLSVAYGPRWYDIDEPADLDKISDFLTRKSYAPQSRQ